MGIDGKISAILPVMNTRLFVLSALSFFIFGTVLLIRMFAKKFWNPVKANNSTIYSESI
tara:strand:+ start:604 stop:780 length:177 start_codon:yes stop_codon:yes gene_type:complete